VTAKTIGSLLTVCLALPSMLWGHDEWFISLYGGKFSNNALLDILQVQTEFESSYVCVFSLGKEIARYRDRISYELEGQIAVHNGRQSHEEINGAVTLRWLPFPWDRYLDTSFAFGNGLSYATAEPPLEILDSDEKKSSQWLYYLFVEISFTHPDHRQWDLFFRTHHRSGVFGLFHDVNSGSNFIGPGIRYRFK
jgi:hypothetical protein